MNKLNKFGHPFKGSVRVWETFYDREIDNNKLIVFNREIKTPQKKTIEEW